MKQRIGFVSNSSSSSFIIVGVETDPPINLSLEQIGKLIRDNLSDGSLQELVGYLKDYRNQLDDDEIFNEEDFLEAYDGEISDLLNETGFNYFHDNDLFGIIIDGTDNGCYEEFDLKTLQKKYIKAVDKLIKNGFDKDRIKLYKYGISPGGDW